MQLQLDCDDKLDEAVDAQNDSVSAMGDTNLKSSGTDESGKISEGQIYRSELHDSHLDI